MPWLISFITGAGGNILIKILPYLLALMAVVGAYFYGEYRGTAACHDAELQAQLNVQNQKLTEMQQQYAAAQQVINSLTDSNTKMSTITKTISDKIGALPKQANCSIDTSVISLINQARSVATGAKK